METTPRRLHPLLTAAAVSVTVFSAVGVASLTGLIPHSLGSQKQDALSQEQASLQAPAEVAKPAEPVIAQPAPQTAPQPVHKKPVVHKSAPKRGAAGGVQRLRHAAAPPPLRQSPRRAGRDAEGGGTA